MITNNSKAPSCTCPSGDGSLRHPCPAHSAAERPELWAVHAQGPDELYAAFSREDAEKHAAELNALPMPEGITVDAVVVSSPWPPAEHWQYLAEQERDHKNEIAVRLRQFERLEDQLKVALARVAELDQALAEKDPFGAKLNRISEKLERCDARLAARAAQAGQVPQAWLDVQTERRRQVEAEGWTPEHDDEHSHGQMARAAACYALAGSSAPNDGTAALLVSLAWPWDEQWWKPSTARRDMVKACALALAEIERLDRAAASQGEPRDA
ncbi:hypothetical protein [Pseudomonas aeruginosa]|uniref:hypothetical protein n=1 Tax=Pseudomonas aeruginosa TaxID=287 RepID=UPI0021C8DB66|nr:hypothetical protein [Pseudomonas aeruginosa]MDS9793272.1 hypothetical protein [Pseudomonas aeruginosa]MDS9838774.1 hypothetical protein [Pseudomonas aeruginosa]MDS9907847.1 hypothetical protein [Pseudomonas aeruginosa]MDS9961723.1 hypothetical protein [Pseudomonas aeruginosa]WNP18476.1 hypothetical protein RPM50_11485 [Pseudomonas aeruginosa]